MKEMVFLYHLRVALGKCLAHPFRSYLNRLFLKAEKNSIHLSLEDMMTAKKPPLNSSLCEVLVKRFSIN